MDVYGLIVLFFSLVIASALLTAAIFGAMFALHKYAAHQIPKRLYGTFDFDHIQKTQLSEFLVRIAATMILHLLEFLTVGIYIRAYPALITVALVVLQAASMAIGFVLILKMDRKRAIVLTSIATAVYLLLYWIFIFGYLQ